MTRKRDFKRRVRQRQERTGESYVTARRQLLASRPEQPPPDDDVGQTLPGDASQTLPRDVDPTRPDRAGQTQSADTGQARSDDARQTRPGDAATPLAQVGAPAAGAEPGAGSPHAGADVPGDRGHRAVGETTDGRSGAAGERARGGISVVELIDVSDEARRFGLVCRVLMFPALARRLEPARVLARLRDLLVATVDDPDTAALASLALTGRTLVFRRRLEVDLRAFARFLQRARAGLGGSFDGGATFAFHVADGDRMVPILCAASARDGAIELTAIDEGVPERWEPLAAMLGTMGAPELTEPTHDTWSAIMRSLAPSTRPRPTLFLIHGQQRYAIDQDEFVIGRSPGRADLVIKDGMVSRRHAAVIRRTGAYYLKDLGSAYGIIYKGMRIDNKRIDEGDAFDIAGHAIEFTYRAE